MTHRTVVQWQELQDTLNQEMMHLCEEGDLRRVKELVDKGRKTGTVSLTVTTPLTQLGARIAHPWCSRLVGSCQLYRQGRPNVHTQRR